MSFATASAVILITYSPITNSTRLVMVESPLELAPTRWLVSED
jgi:hypothetical protein